MLAAVVIGVDRVGGGLPQLQAAASGAKEVAEWLEENDYEVQLFTDREHPVERRRVFQAVEAFVDRGTVTRLIVYFAGHGFLKGPQDELWLLSGAPTDASEAINLSSSSATARYRGIPEVVFISDACRVPPAGGVLVGISGVSIFPNTAPSRTKTKIDMYYATRPGDPAYERTASEATSAHGLFTKELREAHRAAPQAALIEIGGRTYVRNDWLESVLQDRVNQRAESISLKLTQEPDIQIQIRDGYIARNEASGAEQAGYSPRPRAGSGVWKSADAPPHPLGTPRTSAVEKRPRAVSGKVRGSAKKPPARPPRPPRDQPEARPLVIGTTVRANAQFQDRLRILRHGDITARRVLGPEEYNPSITCTGDTITSLVTAHDLETSWRPRSGKAVTIFSLKGPASQVAVQFQDGTGMLVPILRDYACSIVRHEGRTLAVSYTWLFGHDAELAELRSEVLGAATLGLLDRSESAMRELARRLRRAKRFDPTLGLVAALAYILAGDIEGAASVREYMRQDLQADLFDTWLLGGGGDGPPIYPPLPVLAQTWSLLNILDAPVPEDLKLLRRVPGFWTVFEPESMDTVKHLAKNGMQEGSS